VLNYINCDINSNEVNTIAVIPGDRYVYYCSEWDSETYINTFTLNILNRIPDEQMQEEVILTIASASQNYELRNVVIDFNRQNTGVRLNIRTYDEYNNEENDWKGASTQLNADITMGNVPDILVLDSSLPVESYYSKGVLVDLYPYMDDPEKGVNRADYLENVFKACEQDGKLYSLIACFYLQILAAKPEYVGSESGWTMTEMLDALDAMPEGMTAFADYGREELKDMILRYCGDSFLNWEEGTTNFESDDFIRLMEFLKTCPEKSVMTEFYDNMDYDNYDYEAEMEFYNNYEMRFYRDTALFYTSALSNFNGYNQIYRSFAGDATLIGYPTTDENSNGAVITPYLELGICTASPNRDSAWVFLKYLMTSEEYFKDSYGFVIDKGWMEKQLSESEETYKDWYYEYTDEDWERMEDQYSAEYIDYMKKSQMKYQMAHGEMIYDLVQGATKVQRGNEDLMNIINEELSVFFGGARSAAETAKIIDSRARIYISENS
ncbi:MAG: extracellular solute-binding protein, partial [Clostridia bacterium]|nr:extracellular solute-binding protein [Clostridia bacterium]